MTTEEDGRSSEGFARVAGAVRPLLSALVASKLRIAGLAIGGVVLLLGVAFGLGVIGVPEVAGIDNTFGPVTENTTTVETDLRVSNPNPIGVSLGGVAVDYTIDMNDVEMAHGRTEGLSIDSGESTIPLETQLNNSAIPAWWASHVAAGEVTQVGVDARITSSTLGRSTTLSRSRTIETDMIGQFDSEETRPIDANHPLVEDPVLYVNETSASWGEVTEAETPIEMQFVLYNPKEVSYGVSELRYEISMNDVQLGEGATEDPVVIPARSTATLDAETVIRNERLDDWWVTHLNESVHGHQVSRFRIEFEAVVELPTGDQITVPLDELTHEQYVGTDVFDEGGDVGVPPDERGEDGGDGTDDGTGDDGDGADDGSTDGDETDGSTDGDSDDGSTDGGSDDGDDSDDGGIGDGVL